MPYSESANRVIDRYNLDGRIGIYYGEYLFLLYEEEEPQLTFISPKIEKMQRIQMPHMNELLGINVSYEICGLFGELYVNEKTYGRIFEIKRETTATHIFLHIKSKEASVEPLLVKFPEAIYKYIPPHDNSQCFIIVPKDS